MGISYLTKRPFFIAVEGNIGSGKTTLVQVLSESYGITPLIGPYIENPFLQDFYKASQKPSFETEMTFLLLRYNQIQRAISQGLFQGVVISDYIIERSLIFGGITLNSQESKIVANAFDYVSSLLPKPDLIIYLSASSEFLLRRIHARNRYIEIDMSRSYIEKLNQEFNHFFKEFKRSDRHVLEVDALQIDMLKNPDGLAELVSKISCIIENPDSLHSGI